MHDACEAMGVRILTHTAYEADDVIATLATRAIAHGFDAAIVTGDKDFFQMVDGHVRVYNPRDEGTWYDGGGVQEKFGVRPDQVVDVLALMGDAVDNVKGVPGIGEKGARELIAQHGSLDALLAAAPEPAAEAIPRGAHRRTPRMRASVARWCACTATCRWTIDFEALRYVGTRPAPLLRAVQQAGIQDARHRVRADGRRRGAHVQHLRRQRRSPRARRSHPRRPANAPSTW